MRVCSAVLVLLVACGDDSGGGGLDLGGRTDMVVADMGRDDMRGPDAGDGGDMGTADPDLGRDDGGMDPDMDPPVDGGVDMRPRDDAGLGVLPPTLSGTDPMSPSTDRMPEVSGLGLEEATVSLFLSADCTGAVAATAFVEAGAWSATLTVPRNAVTTISANQTAFGGVRTSNCARFTLTYEHDDIPPGPATLTGTVPASPADNVDPAIIGTAPPLSLIELFGTADCSGPSLGFFTTGDAGEIFALAMVANGSTTQFTAQTVDEVGLRSACSAPITYVELP
ncbi:MAG: hypothetical protein AAGH15_23925 [Myxococcota bacterium]